MSLYIGIDPGVSGGIAAVTAAGDVRLVSAMPATERDVFNLLGSLSGDPCRAVLEFVRSSPQMGVTSAFTFGRGYGGLRMALVAVGIPFDEVVPRKWQTALQCTTKGNKNVSKKRAQELFPKVRVTHATADALLLAEYCRRLEVRAKPADPLILAPAQDPYNHLNGPIV
jgi:hypothetical protein